MTLMAQKDSFLTVEQVAEKLGVAEITVRKWLQRKDLQGYKFGKLWKVKESDLERFIESRKQ